MLNSLIYIFCLWEKHPNLYLGLYQEYLAWTSRQRRWTEYRYLFKSSSQSLITKLIVKVGLLLKDVQMKAPPRKLNPKLPKGKAKTHTIEFPEGSEVGSPLDVGVEGEAKITFSSPPRRLRSSYSCTNFTWT